MRFFVLLVLSLMVLHCLADVSQFQQFMDKYNKKYTGPEYRKRLAIFVKNLQTAEILSAKNPDARFGVTKFMDLTPEEFRERYLIKNLARTPKGSNVWQPPAQPMALPTEYDWNNNTTPCITPVYNQEQCGSCWAFSATECIESMWALKGNGLVSLSMQQIVDCDTTCYGCNGGWPWYAFEYVISAGGIDTYDSYQYTGYTGNCQFDPSNVAATISSWQWVTQNGDENAMQSFCFSTGPLSVLVDAADVWQTYIGGVVTASSGCGNSLDHAVQVTGWFTASNGMTVWNVRNSWGEDWGESGYIWIEKGSNVCGIAEDVVSPIV